MNELIDVPEAQATVLQSVRPGPIVRLALREALNRTLAEPVYCDIDYPPFARSLMDGYSVCAEDVTVVPQTLKVVATIAAGSMPGRPLARGEAMQINTGAPIPEGADAVVRIEDTEFDKEGKLVRVLETAARGQFVTLRAAYVSAGQVVLPAGQRLSPLELAVAASAGATYVLVYRKPMVAILSTGDELVEAEYTPKGAQIRNSNQPLLEAMVRRAFAEPFMLAPVRDDVAMIRAGIFEGLKADVLCITGGVSMGEFDFVPRVLVECGAEFRVRKMAIKPGRPTVFATTPNGKLIFALPGNPVSAFVGFELLVRPALAALEGRNGMVPPYVRATLRGAVEGASDRRSFRPGRALVTPDGQWEVSPLSWHGSGDIFGMAGANALIMRPPDSRAASEADKVSILLLDRNG